MISLTFETVDENPFGDGKPNAHQHEVMIELEDNCRDGLCKPHPYSNRWKRFLNIDADCPVCHGTGLIPSENGLKIIEFLNRYT